MPAEGAVAHHRVRRCPVVPRARLEDCQRADRPFASRSRVSESSRPSSAIDDRSDRGRRVRRRAHGPAELFEHDGGVDHREVEDAEVGQAAPHRGVEPVGLVVAPHQRQRRLVGQERAHRRAQHLLLGGELEVHRGRETTVHSVRTQRSQDGDDIAPAVRTRRRSVPRRARRVARRERAHRRANRGAQALERAHDGMGVCLAASAVRRRIPRSGLAARARRLQRDSNAADDLLRGDQRARDHPQREPARPRDHRPVDRRLRHRGAEATLLAADAARRDLVVSRHERTRCGQRPCELEDARRARTATSSL